VKSNNQAPKPKRPAYRSETLARELSHVLMVRPEFFALDEARNPFYRPGVQLDHPLALKQWEGLCKAFHAAQLDVQLLEPRPALIDMCFAADQGFVGVDRDDRSFAIPSRMLHRSRRDEVSIFSDWYSQQGYRILDLDLEGEEFIEGTGDLLWNADWQSVWAGYGSRSTRGAIDLFATAMEEMGFAVRKLELVDAYFYHLDLCLAPLTPDSVMIYPGAFSPETLTTLRTCTNLHEVTREDAMHFVCNGVSVNGFYITPHMSKKLEQILSAEGLEPLPVEVGEFHKAGGSVGQLKMLLP
jgi:N-dimethylarginine dimethylaminohydrolase